MSPPTRGRGSKQRGQHLGPSSVASPPTRGRGSKLLPSADSDLGAGRPPRGGVDRNVMAMTSHSLANRRPPRGGVDRNTTPIQGVWATHRRPPRGGVDRNSHSWRRADAQQSRPPRGGVDRNLAASYYYRAVAEHIVREAGQDGGPDRAPRALPRLPARRGRRAEDAVRQDPAPDRPTARAAHGSRLTGADMERPVTRSTMRRRSVEPAGSWRADLRCGLALPTPTVPAAFASPGLTHNPSRTTVDRENGGYLGDVG